MRLLCVHQNFPGQYLHLVRRIAATRRHDIVFITEPNANLIPGVRKVPYAMPPPLAGLPIELFEAERAFRRAELVAQAARNLRQLGFVPDVILGHHGWGELLNLPDVWPGVPLVGYLEFYYRVEGADVNFDPEFPMAPEAFPRVRAKNIVNHLALALGQHGQTPTEWQFSTYPDWAQPRIALLREGADLDRCKPDPEARRGALQVGRMKIGPRDKLITYVARDLEPYRGFHILMRALPRILKARQDVKAVLVGGDNVSYGAPPPLGSWRQQLLAELGEAIDLTRVALPGKVDYELYLKLLRRSDAHVYFTYPFVASWSLREALASGCAIVASDTAPVREFVAHEETGLLTPFLRPDALADAVLRLLEEKELAARLRAAARRFAADRLDLRQTIEAYIAMLARLTGQKEADIA
ncbi:MAG TPA: glycosyltransferase [Acetobacteraceae bacterium]|nr:glycosyltransferase [Acetobacteraceae bacterium]